MSINKKTIEDIDVKNKKVLVRCDFNVPQDDDGNITDDKRIVESLKTIKYLIDNNAKIILCSHLGRPKGEFNEKYSLKPIAKRLSELLNIKVKMATDVIGENAKKLVSELNDGEVMLLENVRFHKEEEENDLIFAKELANFAEIYVNDAFGTAHRAHASTAGVANYLPAVAGYLIEKEIDILGGVLDNPQRPFVAILGGKKVSDKIGVIENLINKADSIIIGGGMAYTFFKAQGFEIGKSICEEDRLELAKELLEKANSKNVKILLPVDIVCTNEISENGNAITVEANNIPADFIGVDIGEKTIEVFAHELEKAKTIMWNGPMGVFEIDKFAKGTNAIARVLANLDAITIIGGGDSASAIEKCGLADKMTHISTGGGASLEYIEGKVLPGIECLNNK
ncbi:MAG: phosphoglycerate kinase [Clostridia bacterium]|nr:phosphoglycerate kinase [Clostridia bacterium]